MPETLLIRNGRLIDPSQSLDETADLFIADGRVAAVGKATSHAADVVIDADGLIVAPGLIDMHVHLREPGREDNETIESGTAAAVAGGFTTVACMPNTQPAIDSDAQVEFVLRQAERTASCRVLPVGAITRGRKGEELSEMGLMLRAGAVAFSDDGDGVASAAVCLRAMRYLSQFDGLLIQHCEEKSLSGGGCMNAGVVATRLGLPGIPAVAEEVMIQRDLLLARQCGLRYHVAHISTAGAVALVREAKRRGDRVTAEACPHHLLLTDERCATFDTNFKMNPPLRTAADVRACVEGVRDGTIDCLVTDHAPHSLQEKQLDFQAAPMGVIGLETALALNIRALVEPGVIGWPELIGAMSTRPAALLRQATGTLRRGAPADVTLIDPRREWTYDVEQSRSKCRNSPFHGWKLRGKAVATIVAGAVRFRDLPVESVGCASA